VEPSILVEAQKDALVTLAFLLRFGKDVDGIAISDILTEGFSSFIQSLQANACTMSGIGPLVRASLFLLLNF
jgi:hypothetical protein